MMPEDLLIKDYTYHLPEEKIARYPLGNRDESKLLVYDEGIIMESVYKNICDVIPSQSLLVFNNTKVVEVRLLFAKESGSMIELFCLEPSEEYADITTAMLQKRFVTWKCLVGGAKKWKDQPLTKKIFRNGKELILTAEKGAKQNDIFNIQFTWNDDTLSFAEILHTFGNIPLPPYLNRQTEDSDKERYQTIYAKWDGSVAAPTAGLHFTETIFESLNNKSITTDFVTLHVGAGTFKPVKTETVAEHQMHAEYIDVTSAFIERLLYNLGNNVIAVGTTSLRTIESLYWLGVKVCKDENISSKDLIVSQWEAYHLPQDVSAVDALQAVLLWMKKNGFQRLITKTQIIIVPGYRLRIANALITNFHQPQSTLLLLIAAIVGDDWKRIYEHALQNHFRFLSYGDGSLLWYKKKTGHL